METFLAGLNGIRDLPSPDIDLSSFMFTDGVLSDSNSGLHTVPVDYVLWDSGNLSKRTLVSQRFVDTNKAFFEQMTKVLDNSTIPLADGKSIIRVTDDIVCWRCK